MDFSKIAVVLLGVIVLVLIGAALKAASSVLLPLVIAIFLFFILSPLVNTLDQMHFPRIVAIIVVLAALFGVIFLIFLFFQTSINSFISQYPKYAVRFAELSRELNRLIQDRVGVEYNFFEGINWPHTLRTYVLSISGSVMSFITRMVIIFIFLIFLLIEKPYFKGKLAAAFDEETGKRIGRVIDHLNNQISRYLNLKFFISLATGFLVWLTLAIIGLDFAVIWGVLAFLLNFIPNIGSTIVLLVTILMSFIQFFPSYGPILAVTISMAAIQVTVGNFLDPKLQGHRLNLSAFLILVSLIFWGWIWGIVGMFLAVPITAIIQIICENIPFLRPVSVLMGSGKVHKNPKS